MLIVSDNIAGLVPKLLDLLLSRKSKIWDWG